MNEIKVIVKLIPPAIVFFAVAWFVSFQFNPYRWCDDHPDPELRDDYFLCEPFGFDLDKSNYYVTRDPNDRFAGEDKRIYLKKDGKKTKKDYNCNEATTLMTQDGYDFCMGKNK